MRCVSDSQSSRCAPGSPRGTADLAVEEARLGQKPREGLDQFGEVAGQRLRATAADLDVLPVPRHERAEAVPLGLIAQAAGRLGGIGDVRHRLGEHGGGDLVGHGSILARGLWRREGCDTPGVQGAICRVRVPA